MPKSEDGLTPDITYHRISKYEYEEICRAQEYLESIITSTDLELIRSYAKAVLNILDNEWE